jgi:hypothetical protein
MDYTNYKAVMDRQKAQAQDPFFINWRIVLTAGVVLGMIAGKHMSVPEVVSYCLVFAVLVYANLDYIPHIIIILLVLAPSFWKYVHPSRITGGPGGTANFNPFARRY